MEKFIPLANLFLLAINLIFLYYSFKRNRKKDFEDQLFKTKLTAYYSIAEKCFEALLKLDAESTPFNKIYEIKDKDEWELYFQKNISPLYEVGFNLMSEVNRHSILLPNEILKELNSYSNLCLGYVTNYFHLDSNIVIDCEERLWKKYNELINSIRTDLKIELIDESLNRRISKSII